MKNISLLFTGLCLLCLILSTTTMQDNTLGASKLRGQKLYTNLCAGCHKPDGTGYTARKLSPPLANSDYLLKNKKNGIEAVLFGLKGKIVVNDVEYDRVMPPVDWTDQELSDVLNYVRNSWGNEAPLISAGEVTEIREVGKESDK